MNRPKGSRVTLQQVAEHAGVSRATASLIVRGSPLVAEKTRKKVQESMRQLGYVYDRVAANLRSRSSLTIGLIITEISNSFFAEILAGVHETLDKDGYTVILGTTLDSEAKQEQLISTMLEYRVGGVIMSPVAGSTSEPIERLIQCGIPVVLVSREPMHSSFDYVGADNLAGARMAVEYLIGLGHTRIALLGGPPDSKPWKDRKQGYAEALQQAGLELDESLILASPVSRPGGAEALRQILRHSDPPTAAFCYNDIVAFGVMQGLKSMGLTPGPDFAVVGFDDIPESGLYNPSLTTVSAFPQLIGTYAAELLHKHILGKVVEPQRIIIKPELVIRESCSRMKGYK